MEEPDAIRIRMVAIKVNTHSREDATQATPPIKGIEDRVEPATNFNGQHDRVIVRHDNQRCMLSLNWSWQNRDHTWPSPA